MRTTKQILAAIKAGAVSGARMGPGGVAPSWDPLDRKAEVHQARGSSPSRRPWA